MGEPGRIMSVDVDGIVRSFGRSPLVFQHGLADMESFSLGELADLSGRMPLTSIEVGRCVEETGGTMTAATAVAPVADVIASVDAQQAWVVLKDIQQDSHYRPLVDAVLGEIEKLVNPNGERFAVHRGHVFIASMGAVTPSHADDDEGFLLQLHGRKELTLYDMGRSYFSPRLARQRERSSRVFTVPSRHVARLVTIRLERGDGLYVPWRWPHSAKALPGTPSVSLNVSFETPSTRHRALAALANDALLRFGLRPRALGHGRSYPVKAKVGAALARAGRPRR